jgi:hypothetical protein
MRVKILILNKIVLHFEYNNCYNCGPLRRNVAPEQHSV